MIILRKGSVGEEVKIIQKFLNITQDGSFGTQTENAVKQWQKANGLVADGIVGEKTWCAMANLGRNIGVIYNPIYKHITKCNERQIKYIVIHYTAGVKSTKGTSTQIRNVFLIRNASADFVVDNEDIIQINPNLRDYYTWAVGDKKNIYTKGGSLYGIATNKNTINIEICSTLVKGTSQTPNHEGWIFKDEAIQQTIKLCKSLMKEFNIPLDRIVRHYDVSGKLCPGIIGWNSGSIYTLEGKLTNKFSDSKEWLKFKEQLR